MKRIGITGKTARACSAALLIGGLAAFSLGCSLLTPTPAGQPIDSTTAPVESCAAIANDGSGNSGAASDNSPPSKDSGGTERASNGRSASAYPDTSGSASASPSTDGSGDSSSDAYPSGPTSVSGSSDGSGSGSTSSSGADDSGTITRRVPGGGTSGTSRIVPTPTAEYVPPSDLLPRNTVGLILAVTGGTNTGTVKTIVTNPGTGENQGTAFIGLESTSKSVLLYLPDTGEATVLDSYSSASYAPQFKRPYTANSRLFVSNKFTDGGALRLTEYDPKDLSRELEWGTQSDALDPGYAVVGDQVFCKNDTEDRWGIRALTPD